MTRRLIAVSAGLSEPSSTRLLADRLARESAEALNGGETGGAEVRTVELRGHAHAIADAMLSGFPSGALREVVDDVAAADGLILVTPTFTASYSGLFKSFIDVLDPDALQGKPVLLGATGGTERHSLMIDHAMRPLMAYLRAMPAPTGVYAASTDWGAAGLDQRIGRAAGEFAAMVAGGPVRQPVRDGFADPVPFAELLGG
ncbi:FMN reductase [Tomitella fengzijianii]|uniref:NADPH-dependent FMN reductase n=1 Tax=Tomitella fengzijianii TaxID=2597660 RepID=A0A516X6P0_9ACTN|nr:FMN reductase [Tomitella fengzijianii]QDQ98744.1 NADPH-dependent FMN reductase [Tomitella fengzijianii]